MIRSLLLLCILVYGIIALNGCSSVENTDHKSDSKAIANEMSPTVISPSISKDTTISIDFQGNSIQVVIQFPRQHAFKGTIIALPGWNFPNTQWCDSTDLCKKALANGYAVVLPEMGKSIYCDTVFPETRKDWLKYPTRRWMKETMIPKIQREFNLLRVEQDNFILGLSTGARGAVLLALDLPTVFSGCAALSGDFDQTRYTKDNLYNGYYGSYEKFTDRWVNNDNAITSIQKLTVPIYLAHGEKDAIVPIAYSMQLFSELQKAGNDKSALNANPLAGHTYSFWNSEVDSVLEFFEKLSKKQ